MKIMRITDETTRGCIQNIQKLAEQILSSANALLDTRDTPVVDVGLLMDVIDLSEKCGKIDHSGRAAMCFLSLDIASKKSS